MPDILKIVGIGASAGGLEAFEKILLHAPVDTGMSFVLIQHLDPEHNSMLTEILQRSTSMPVSEVTDGVVVRSNHVYVIPPKYEMTIKHGILHLSALTLPRGIRLPIDAFLTSLAIDQGPNAIGIILSGTGTDGAKGLNKISNTGGLTIIQDPASAQYNGMPQYALSINPDAIILKPEEILFYLSSGLNVKNTSNISSTNVIETTSSVIYQILLILKNATGHDFTEYKISTIKRRVERRMSQNNIAVPREYVLLLKNHQDEIKKLLNDLLINVTSFFRDPLAFEALETEILPRLFDLEDETKSIRIWVAGCATGEEAYSIAILLREYMDHHEKEFRIQLYATDLDQDAINTARLGIYPETIAKDINPSRLKKYFIQENGGFRINKKIRQMVIFSVQNIISDPPLIKLDLLCCRNLMIYLEAELQNKLIPKFNFALREGAILFLSPAESIGNHTDLFKVINRKFKLYQAIKSPLSLATILKIKKQIKVENTVNTPNDEENSKLKNIIRTESALNNNNEELQSINEELQSANEELETSKEELQSVNEELVTVNAELQIKIDQLAGIQNDMKNLLDNMNIGTIFLDEKLIIRRFTREAVRAYRLIESDLGRPLEDITSNLINADLIKCAQQVLTSHNPYEVELSTKSGAWYLVHLQPYKTLDDVIKGVVMTFADITKRVEAESATLLAKTLAEGIVDTVLEPLVVLTAELKVQSASRSFFSFFKVTPQDTLGRLIYDLGNRQWDIAALRELLETILPKQQNFEGYIVEHDFQDIGHKKMSLNARSIIDRTGNTQLILFAMQEI